MCAIRLPGGDAGLEAMMRGLLKHLCFAYRGSPKGEGVSQSEKQVDVVCTARRTR
jgi:hypothetical protein